MTDPNTPALQSIIAEMRTLANQIGKQADNVSDHSSHTTSTRLNEWAMQTHKLADKLANAGIPTNCDEADQLLLSLRLDPTRFRSEGGWFNPGKIRAAILNPKDYDGLYLSPTGDDIDRAVEAYDDVYDGVSHNHRAAMKAALTTAPPTLTAPSADCGWKPIESADTDAGGGEALTFDAFRAANKARCIKWHPAGIASWSPSDWLTAVTGELGELASLLKMRNRERDGLPGNKFSPTDKQVADELADVLTYLDLLAEVLGVNLGQAAVSKFNEVSERVGFPDRIELAHSGPVAVTQPAQVDPYLGTR